MQVHATAGNTLQEAQEEHIRAMIEHDLFFLAFLFVAFPVAFGGCRLTGGCRFC